MSVTWKLPEKLVELSVATTWGEAVKEWELNWIEMLEPNEESHRCLCNHTPIRELCHITNKSNGQKTILGNVCIGKIGQSEDFSDSPIKEVPKVIAAAKRLRTDENASANAALIHYARSKGYLNDVEETFYLDKIRKTKLTQKQRDWKKKINHKLLYHVCLSAKAAFERLKKNPVRGTAGPKLIEHALTRGVLTDANAIFYRDVWRREYRDLTPNQQKYRKDLNEKMIKRLTARF